MIIVSLHQSSAQILERHIDDCFEMNSKQINEMDNKCDKTVKSIKQILDSVINLVPENIRKQNSDESHTNKYHDHVGCSFGYKLVRADDQFTKPFVSNLGQYVIHTFIVNMVKESKYWDYVMKNILVKKLLLLNKMLEIFIALENV